MCRYAILKIVCRFFFPLYFHFDHKNTPYNVSYKDKYTDKYDKYIIILGRQRVALSFNELQRSYIRLCWVQVCCKEICLFK